MATYACADLHGRLDLYLKIKKFLQPDDVVYFLGDAGDRGSDGWELIKTIYNDEQFIYMKGNHEDMLIKAMLSWKRNPYFASKEYKDLERNGGQKTLEDWLQDGKDFSWVEKLNALPLHLEYFNKNGIFMLLSHAGYTPWTAEDNKRQILIPDPFNLLWNRDHFYDDWIDEDCFSNGIIVHGHTRIPSLMLRLCDKRKELPTGSYWYCNNHKVCIDNSAITTGVAILLNLDTLSDVIIGVND